MKRKKVITMIAAALAFTMTVCGSSTAIAASELTAESKPATQYTIDAKNTIKLYRNSLFVAANHRKVR